MSMMGKAVSAGAHEAMYRNPAYQGYQNAISLLGNKSNGDDSDAKIFRRGNFSKKYVVRCGGGNFKYGE